MHHFQELGRDRLYTNLNHGIKIVSCTVTPSPPPIMNMSTPGRLKENWHAKLSQLLMYAKPVGPSAPITLCDCAITQICQLGQLAIQGD